MAGRGGLWQAVERAAAGQESPSGQQGGLWHGGEGAAASGWRGGRGGGQRGGRAGRMPSEGENE